MSTSSPSPRFLFIDIEASSLETGGFPIELGWSDQNGRGDAYLVKPPPEWTKWSKKAEALHGISRERLMGEGLAPAVVAKRFSGIVDGAIVVADAPAFDRVWLSMIFEGSGIPIPVVEAIQIPYARAVAPLTALLKRQFAESKPSLSPEEVASRIVAKYEALEAARDRKRHRAMEDALGLWWTWKEIRASAQRMVDAIVPVR